MAWTISIAKDGDGDLARLTVVWNKDLSDEFIFSQHIHLDDFIELGKFRIQARNLRNREASRTSNESSEAVRLTNFMNQPE